MSDNKPWIGSYPPGATETINTDMYGNVLELIERTTAEFASSTAIIGADESLSFGELLERSRAWAAYLCEISGIRPGERIAVMLPNLAAFPVVLLGALRCGAVQVNVNPLYTARELQHQLADSGARVLVVFHEALPVVTAALEGTAVEQLVQVGGTLGTGPAPRPITMFGEALARGRAAQGWKPPAIGRDDLALLQYTGGTTGVSKGAELTHGNLVANVLQARAMLGGAIEPGRETIITALPLYHIFALTVNLLTFLSFGARNVLVANPRDPAQLVAAFTNEKITVVTGVNTLFGALLALPQLKDVDYRQVKLAIGGGTAVQRAVSDAWHARSGRHILEGYGLSETSPVVSINSFANPDFTASIGVPLPSTDVIIADDEGKALGTGVEGEICVKGPQVMRGYWLRPEATSAAFTADGYFRTGDVGVMDAHGFIRICDRKKDMVLVSGFNVYPNEVEDVIAAIPGVAECAVTGVPDARSGEAVKAFVVRKDPALTESAILAHCREQLAAYKVPKSVVFVDGLPKSTVGKILRRELRNAASA